MATKSCSALVLTDEVVLPIGAALSAIRNLGGEAVSGDDVLGITQCDSLGGRLPVESATLDVIMSVWKNPQLVEEQWLKEITRVLKPSGKVLVQTTLPPFEQDRLSTTLERKFLLYGFLEVQSVEMTVFFPREDVRTITFIGKKAPWTIGSSFPLKKATKTVPKIQIDDESDLIDEDSLLTEEDLKNPQLPPVGDCEVGSTRKACKNCTCGRAEAEEKVEKLGLVAEKINNPQSACGSCGLGDAFRCGSCPYRGLPPFKLGEKVSLPGNFLVADI